MHVVEAADVLNRSLVNLATGRKLEGCVPKVIPQSLPKTNRRTVSSDTALLEAASQRESYSCRRTLPENVMEYIVPPLCRSSQI